MYKELSTILGSNTAASEFLQSLGILGHKYAAEDGENSEFPNYVIFDDSRIETNFVKFDQEGTGTPTKKATSLADRQPAIDYIEKVLGPEVVVQFKKSLGATTTLGSWTRTKLNTVIKLSIFAGDPLSIAHHEAAHEFFQRLLDTDPASAAILAKAANSAPVVAQLNKLYAKYPRVIKAMKTDEHERVAYMFEAWAGGVDLKLGPQTKTVFQKIKHFLKTMAGFISEGAQAERLMVMFHDGKLAERNEIAQIIANDPILQAKYADRMLEASQPIINTMKYLIGTAHGQTAASKNPKIAWAGKQFYVGITERTNQLGFLSEKSMRTSQMMGDMVNVFTGLDKTERDAVMEAMQAKVDSKDPKILHTQNRLRHFFKKMRTYGNRPDADYGYNGMDIHEVDNYFPVVWDSENLADNRAQFITELHSEHQDILERIAKKGRTGWEDGKPKHFAATADEVAERIADVLIKGRGAAPNEESLWDLGYKPYMAAKHSRKLDWLNPAVFSKYQSKDMVDTMSTYVNQMVHTVEYTKRFGEKGEKLQQAVNDAAVWELENHSNKAYLDAYNKAKVKLDKEYQAFLTKELAEFDRKKKAGYVGLDNFKTPPMPSLDDYIAAAEKIVGGHGIADMLHSKLGGARKQIMAMEGTLGFDVSERMRAIQGNLIVYESLRTLWMSLFANFVDPMGIVVNNGSVADAFEALKVGLAGVADKWRGVESEHPAYREARIYGTVDASHMLNTMGQVYSSVWMNKTARKLNEWLFRVNGVEGFGQGVRAAATPAARHRIQENLKSKAPEDLRQMKELYGEEYKPEDVKLDKEGNLDPTDYRNQRAMYKLVDRMTLRPNAAMRPAYGSDQRTAIFFHLKQFTYAFQKVMLGQAYKESQYGNYKPAMVLIAGYVPMMIAADMLKDLVQYGEEAPWKKKWKMGDYLAHGIQRAGLLGVPQIGVDTLEWGPSELGGPAVGQLDRAIKDAYKAVRRDIALDDKAEATGRASDAQNAEDYVAAEKAGKKILRDALPASQLFKRHIFDPITA